MPTYVNHIDQLEEHSTWRRYDRGLRELTLLEAPKSIISQYKWGAAQNCFLAFADLMLDGNLKVAPFHEIIASNFESAAKGECPRLIVSCPPRSGKSMLSQVFVAWLLGRDQETQHIIASYGAQLSNRFLRGIHGYLRHKNFKRVFPNFMGHEADSKYDLAGGGYILGTSVGGVLTGFTAGSKSDDSEGVGAIVIDDPLKSSDSKAALQGLESWWGEQASTRRTNRFAQVLIGTRFHERDLHGVLMDSDGLWDEEENPMGWRWVNIPGVCEKEEGDPLGRSLGESHWPTNSAFAPEMLKSQKRAMGSTAFAALYQGTPTSAEGAIIKPGWLCRLIDDEIPKEFDTTYLALDTAFSEKEQADESVICVASTIKGDENLYIRDLVTGRWGFPDLVAMLEQTQRYYRARFLCIEQAASGQSLIQVLERETSIHCHKFKPLKSKTIRLQTVSPLFESGRIKFCDGEWTDSFFKEICAFPHVPHDDRTDAVVWAATYFSFHLDASNNRASTIHSGVRRAGRGSLFGEFTEQKVGDNRGRRTMFSEDSGETFKMGNVKSRSRNVGDMSYDTGL